MTVTICRVSGLETRHLKNVFTLTHGALCFLTVRCKKMTFTKASDSFLVHIHWNTRWEWSDMVWGPETQTWHLLFSVWRRAINMRAIPIFHCTCTDEHLYSCDSKDSRLPCDPIWVAKYPQLLSLVHFVFKPFRHTWEGEMTTCTL